MDQQPVYMDLDSYGGLRLIQQNSDEQLQQQFQSQGIIMTNDQSQQDASIQDGQSHVVYSPLKQNEQSQTQYITQDDSMQNQYLIQSPAPQQQQQQVFYTTNISPQNRIQQQQHQQTIALNHNLITQQNQQKFVLQAPKVVVQRNTDILQNATNMAQIVDHQNQPTIQYHFTPQMEQTQTQQVILQQQPTQQIKQTIYPNQGGQVVSHPQYIQFQQFQPAQGTKIVMQTGNNNIRYGLIQKPQQQIVQNQAGQILQINQQPQQLQTPSPRQFRPRMITSTPMRLQQGVRVGSPQMQQALQTVSIAQQRARLPKPRVVRPTAQSPGQQQQQTTMQINQRPQQQGKVVYILQQQSDGSQVLVPHPQYTQQAQQQQVVRMMQQKVAAGNQQQQQQYVVQAQIVDQQQQASQTEEPLHPPTTSTFAPKKDGDCDDLEDSITATAISKSARSEPPPLQPQSGLSISMDEYRKRGLPQLARVGVVRPALGQAGNQVRSPTRNAAMQVIRQRPAPRPTQFQQPGLQQELEVPERESAKMLVILDNGEQRLITFTLPKETCTVQELLDQVGIQVGADSNIECIENPGSEIDYIVKVGNFALRDTASMTKAAENHIRQQQQRQQLIQSQRNNILQHQQPQQTQIVQTTAEIGKSKSPEIKLPPAKYVTGFYAVCAACGFSGADHAKCERCQRVFTEQPKMQRMPIQKNISLPTIAGTTQPAKVLQIVRHIGLDKKDQIEAIQKKHQLVTAQRQNATRGRGGLVTSTPRGRGGPRGPRKPIVPDIVTLSSDDEMGSDESKSSAAKALAAKQEEKVPLKKSFEPEIVEDIVADDFVRLDINESSASEPKLVTSIVCRTVRIGSYKFDSKENVVITSKGIRIVAPSLRNKEPEVLNIQNSEVVKVVMHFSKQLNIIFLYTKPSCARYITDKLQMSKVDDKSPYYSPVSRSEPQKKIVFLAETVSEESKGIIKSIYTKGVLDEINNRDANEMLVRSTGIPLTSTSGAHTTQTPNTTVDGTSLVEPEVRKLLIYPPGRGGIAINTHDYICLGSDNYLNDVIIDFYLKYLHKDKLSDDQRSKTHIFSQFFYKRLTTLSKDQKDQKLTAAQKRHARVASWTKSVNLFEKDYIIIPINEQSHWFLAIVCFPNLTEPHTMDTNQPIKLIPVQKRAKKKSATVQIGSTTITPLSKREDTINLNDDEGSERDEAEGDDSELGSNLESEDEEEVVDKGQPVKVPCILIFDSLLGAPRNRVVATLRDYLTCEYKAKYPDSPLRQYTKLNLAGNQVKVPQQNNFTDCGLFLLQYVEQFYMDPIKDFRLPIKSLCNWFHQDVVTRKREEIAHLIRDLITRNTPETFELPEIEFPTKDGKILEQQIEAESDNVEGQAFDDDEYLPTEEDYKELSQNGAKEEVKRVYVTKKRSLDKNDSSSSENNAKAPKLHAKNKS